MVALRAADPADDMDVAALALDWQTMLARIDADAAVIDPVGRAVVGRGRARQRTRRLRLAGAAVLVACAAIFVGVIAWPGSGQGPSSVAYGVTREPDGTVAVRRSPTQPFTSADLQSQLRAAGVPADVLVVSPAGACAEPPPSTVASVGQVITYPSTISRGDGFVIHPAAIPAGAVLVVVLPAITRGQVNFRATPAFAGLYVTLSAPTCVAEPAAAAPTLPPPASSPSK
jgi:hypothetical protein